MRDFAFGELRFVRHWFCDAGIVIRRFAHCDAAGHSSNWIGCVGYVEVTQKLDHGTVLAAQPVPFAPHSHVATLGWTALTWKCRWMPVDQPVVPDVASG
jgi:hypothetical protein